MNKQGGQENSQNIVRLIKRTLARILPVCLFSIFISAFILTVANDMYAFVKEDRDVSLYVEAPYSIDDFSMLLGKEGIVKNPYVFTLYVKSKNKVQNVEEFTGELLLNENMSYREILAILS